MLHKKIPQIQESLQSNTCSQKHYRRCLNCILLPHLTGNPWKAFAISHNLLQSLKNALSWKLSASSSCTVSSVYIIQIHLQNGTCFISPSQKMGSSCTKNSCFNIPAVAFFRLETSATPKPSLKGTTNTSYERPWDKLMRQTHARSIFSKVYRL